MEIKIEQSELRKSGIYIIKNNINDLIYIGSSVRLKDRIRKHKEALNRGNHSNKKLQNFYNKYGEESLYFELLEVVYDKKLLLEREQYWFNLLSPFYEKGFNICVAAGSNLGLKMSEENKKKLSERMKGKNVAPNYIITDEHREHLSKLMTGNKYAKGKEMSLEQRLSISERMIGHKFNLGKKISKEHKKRISESNKGHTRSKRKIVLVYKDGVLIDECNGVIEMAKKYNFSSGNVSSVCKGIRKSIGGLTLKYKE